MVKIYEKLMVLLDRQQKRKMMLLVFLMLIGAVLETLGVSMVMPVMNVVLEEDAIAKHDYLQVICRIWENWEPETVNDDDIKRAIRQYLAQPAQPEI